ncbi:MAG: LysR family transcriptional regulator [Psychrilyobacter sp.]|nr:LysR family transcriptional regulator [Psychrilyobacter sp.]
MDLHYLRIFYEVAKECSFTKAANNLYINQSAVSIQVKKFEELLGTKLFDRRTKKIKLTYSGEVLYKMSEEIFQKVKRVEKEMARIVEVDRARINIGATAVIGEPLLPKLMKEFSATYSEIEYDVLIASKKRIIEKLKDGEIDIAIIDEIHLTDSNLEIIDVAKFPLCLVSVRDYRDIKDVVETPLIVRNKILKHNEAITALESEHQVEFKTKIPIHGSLSVIKSFVKEKVGNAVLPYYSVYEEVKSGEFKIIEKIDEVTDGYQIAITKDKRSLLEIIKFINFIKNFQIGG